MTTPIRLGLLRLTDSAPVVVAQTRNLFQPLGLAPVLSIISVVAADWQQSGRPFNRTCWQNGLPPGSHGRSSPAGLRAGSPSRLSLKCKTF